MIAGSAVAASAALYSAHIGCKRRVLLSLSCPTLLYILFMLHERKRTGEIEFRGLPSGVHTQHTYTHTDKHTGYLNSPAGLFALFTSFILPAIMLD